MRIPPPAKPMLPAPRRYPGRACLLGEHCDWYGGSSLAVPLPMAVRALGQPGPVRLSISAKMDGHTLKGAWPGPAVHRGPDPLRFVPAAAWLLEQQGLLVPNTHLTVQSDLPTGRGFSSSAAFCLAVLDALSLAAGAQPAPAVLAEWAYTVEHDLLGVACGRLDPLACVAQAPVFLQWRGGRAPIQRVPIGGEMWLMVSVFSAPQDTPAILAALHRPSPAVDAALAVFDSAARAAASALAAGNTAALGAEMNAAQAAYEAHLSTLPALAAPRLVQACADLRSWGAAGAKFSGAGGDGSVIALFDTPAAAARARAALAARQMASWVVPLNPQLGQTDAVHP